MLADSDLGPYVLPCLALVLVSVLLASRSGQQKLPDLPWINHDKDEWFGKLRARLRTLTDFRGTIGTAYSKVSCIRMCRMVT